MTNACDIFARLCVAGIEADREQCRRNVRNSTATLTALVERIGYDAAEHLANELQRRGRTEPHDIEQMVIDHGLMTAEEFDQLTSAANIIKLGSTTAQ